MIFGKHAVLETDDSEEEQTTEEETEQPTPKLAFAPEELKDIASKVGQVLSVILFGSGIVGYFSVFINYKNALSRHEKLNTLMQTPNARVASGEQVERVTQQLQSMQQEVEAK